jgi:hypothetical protein
VHPFVSQIDVYVPFRGRVGIFCKLPSAMTAARGVSVEVGVGSLTVTSRSPAASARPRSAARKEVGPPAAYHPFVRQRPPLQLTPPPRITISPSAEGGYRHSMGLRF